MKLEQFRIAAPSAGCDEFLAQLTSGVAVGDTKVAENCRRHVVDNAQAVAHISGHMQHEPKTLATQEAPRPYKGELYLAVGQPIADNEQMAIGSERVMFRNDFSCGFATTDGFFIAPQGTVFAGWVIGRIKKGVRP